MRTPVPDAQGPPPPALGSYHDGLIPSNEIVQNFPEVVPGNKAEQDYQNYPEVAATVPPSTLPAPPAHAPVPRTSGAHSLR